MHTGKACTPKPLTGDISVGSKVMLPNVSTEGHAPAIARVEVVVSRIGHDHAIVQLNQLGLVHVQKSCLSHLVGTSEYQTMSHCNQIRSTADFMG